MLDEGREITVAEVPAAPSFPEHNALRSLPAEFFTLQNVALVYLNKNRLDAIPPDIAKMKDLLGMYFTGNNISGIPPEVFHHDAGSASFRSRKTISPTFPPPSAI